MKIHVKITSDKEKSGRGWEMVGARKRMRDVASPG
jgi:hypothetical protein